MTDTKLTDELKRYADNVVARFVDLEFPASITVVIETDDKYLQTCSLRRSDFNSLIINTVIREINLLASDTAFLHVLQRAIENK